MAPSIMEQVEAEAQAAEAEFPEHAAPDEVTPEPEPDPSTEPEPEPEPAPEQPSDKAMEAIGKKLDAESDRHKRRVAEIMGDQMGDLAPCPLCLIDGFVMSEAPPEFDPMQRLAVLTAMGDVAPPKLKQHPNLFECQLCDGQGDLLTGSKRSTAQLAECPDCGGKGFRDKTMMQAQQDARGYSPQPPVVIPPPNYGANGQGPTQPTVTQGIYTFPLIQGGAPDPLGRLAGHPLWGQDESMGGL